MSRKLSKEVKNAATTDESLVAVDEMQPEVEQTTATVNPQPTADETVNAEIQMAADEQPNGADVQAAVDEQTPDDEKLTFKSFFAKIGKAVKGFFVSKGKAIANFFVRAWRKTVKFFKDVGIFFKMLFTPKKKGETVEGDEVVAVNEEVEAMRGRVKHFFRKRSKDEWKTFLLGNNEEKGFVQKFVSYALLILFGFVYAYPMLYMLGYSLMGESDVLNPMVNYLPTEWQWSNYREAAQTLTFFNTLLQTAYISVLPSLFQTIACGITAYGLARFNFPGKKVLFAMILLTFIIPPQLIMMPQLIIFTNVGFAGNVLSFMVPAALGQGIKSAVFILIFYQFFKGIPDSIVEAAKIDGANSIQIFLKIGIPAAMPAILLSFLLSVVWYYNETVLSSVYLGNSVKMLPLELEKFQATYQQLFPSTTTGKSVNEAIYMAGTLLNILPLIVMYFFTQRYFVDGIDKAGITGE